MPDCPPWCSTAHEPAQPHRHTEHGVTLLQAPGDTVPRIVVHYGPNRGAYTPTAARTLADVARMAGHTEHADALQAAATTAEAATPNRDIDESSLPVAADVWAALDEIAERTRPTDTDEA